MEAIDCIRSRRTIRKFQRIPVEWYKVGKILEAGLSAPSAGNIEDFRLLVVTDEQKKKDIAHFCMDQVWMVNAPLYIVVNSTFTKTQRFYGIRGERLYSIQSAAAAIQNILLAAHCLELGAAWVGAFDEDSIKELLNIPDYARVQAVIPIGYADEIPPKPPKCEPEQMVHFNMYGDNAGKVWDIRKDMLKEWSPYTEEIVQKCKDAIEKGAETCNNAGIGLGKKLKDHAKRLHGNLSKSKQKDKQVQK